MLSSGMTNKQRASDEHQQKEHSKRESSAGAKALRTQGRNRVGLFRSKWPSGWSMKRWRLKSRPCNPRLIYHEVNE